MPAFAIDPEAIECRRDGGSEIAVGATASLEILKIESDLGRERSRLLEQGIDLG
jgi:hypothetical protein